MKKNVIETLVGLLILFLCSVFVTLIYDNQSISYKNKDTYKVYAEFDNISGIDVGSDVDIAGIAVGKVVSKELDLNLYTAKICMEFESKVKLSSDSFAEVVSSGFLGNKYISIVPGADSEMLEDGDSISLTQSALSMEHIINKVLFGMIDNNDEGQYANDAGSDIVSGPVNEEVLVS